MKIEVFSENHAWAIDSSNPRFIVFSQSNTIEEAEQLARVVSVQSDTPVGVRGEDGGVKTDVMAVYKRGKKI